MEQRDEMIIWHSIATWVCCLNPNKVYHDPFAQDEHNKKANVTTKMAVVKIIGDKIKINETINLNNMNTKTHDVQYGKKVYHINETRLREIINESVRYVLNEAYTTAKSKSPEQAYRLLCSLRAAAHDLMNFDISPYEKAGLNNTLCTEFRNIINTIHQFMDDLGIEGEKSIIGVMTDRDKQITAEFEYGTQIIYLKGRKEDIFKVKETLWTGGLYFTDKQLADEFDEWESYLDKGGMIALRNADIRDSWKLAHSQLYGNTFTVERMPLGGGQTELAIK